MSWRNKHLTLVIKKANPSPIDLVLKPTDLAYIAGIIDGEGCITINVTKNDSFRSRSIQHILKVIVRMVEEEAIIFLRNKFGGSISIQKPSKGRIRFVYQWTLCGKYASSFLAKILPYLKVKANQAKVGINFQAGFPKQRHPLSQEEFTRRNFLYNQMRELNHPV